MAFENFPYTNFHEINLDWIVAKVKEAYSASNPPDYPVKSINGMTGDVIIAIPANLVSSVNGETGDVVLYRNPLTQFPATDEQRWNLFRICDGDERGIEFDEDGAHRIEGTRRILIYDEENQPDFPVTSVNGQTGDVRISAGVNSVNGKTGNVVTPFINPNTDILKLDSNSNTVLWGISRDVAGGNVALYISRGTGTPQAFIRYTPDQGEAVNLPLLSSADIPESAGVVSVNSKTGVVTLYGTDILLDNASAASITEAINNTNFFIDAITDSIYTMTPGDSSQWSRAIYSPGTGGHETASRHIKLNNDLSAKCAIIKSVNGNLLFFLCAWDSENNWMGLYDPATGLFRPYQTTLSNLVNLTMRQINIADVRNAYPAYRFRIMARYADSTDIYTEEAANIEFYELNIDSGASPDISELQETVAGHTSQISVLQEKDTTQDQQISALQADDSAHNSQISALQADDSTHTQQIAELQSNDATHNSQISALQAKDTTQDQQISELYTRTGIYEIFIENVASLPLRYPATGTDAKIKSTNIVVDMVVYISGVQVSDWKINTYDGYLEITGTINGLSSITLYLA